MADPDTVITPYRDGPLLVRGAFQLLDQDGNEIELGGRETDDRAVPLRQVAPAPVLRRHAQRDPLPRAERRRGRPATARKRSASQPVTPSGRPRAGGLRRCARQRERGELARAAEPLGDRHQRLQPLAQERRAPGGARRSRGRRTRRRARGARRRSGSRSIRQDSRRAQVLALRQPGDQRVHVTRRSPRPRRASSGCRRPAARACRRRGADGARTTTSSGLRPSAASPRTPPRTGSPAGRPGAATACRSAAGPTRSRCRGRRRTARWRPARRARQVAAQRVVDRERRVRGADGDVHLQRADQLRAGDVAVLGEDRVVALARVERAERRGVRVHARRDRPRPRPGELARAAAACRELRDRVADRGAGAVKSSACDAGNSSLSASPSTISRATGARSSVTGSTQHDLLLEADGERLRARRRRRAAPPRSPQRQRRRAQRGRRRSPMPTSCAGPSGRRSRAAPARPTARRRRAAGPGGQAAREVDRGDALVDRVGDHVHVEERHASSP